MAVADRLGKQPYSLPRDVCAIQIDNTINLDVQGDSSSVWAW